MLTSPPQPTETAAALTAASPWRSEQSQAHLRTFCIAAGILILAFSKVLLDLLQYGLKTQVYSHILLVPFISGWLVWQRKTELPGFERSAPLMPALLALSGLSILGAWAAFHFSGAVFSQNDYLAFTVPPFILLFAATVIYFLGAPFAKSITFPLFFLIFMIPFPDRVTELLEIGSQYASAEVYSWMMDLSQATYFRQGLVFALPNLTIQVAQECSGIRSSFVLFITSLLAANMFLTTGWRRFLLAFAVFPLGIARNAFRIYVLSMLSAHWNPKVIHSPLHSQGGPIFFVLSLIPFFALLLFLRKSESQKPQPSSANK